MVHGCKSVARLSLQDGLRVGLYWIVLEWMEGMSSVVCREICDLIILSLCVSVATLSLCRLDLTGHGDLQIDTMDNDNEGQETGRQGYRYIAILLQSLEASYNEVILAAAFFLSPCQSSIAFFDLPFTRRTNYNARKRKRAKY